MDGNGREWKGKTTWEVEKLEDSRLSIRMTGVEKIEYQGFRISRYAAELAEREGIDVGLIKRQLELSPRERIEQSQKAADFISILREAGKRMRNER